MFARNLFAAPVVPRAALTAACCSDAAGDVDQFSDCNDFCGQYQDCSDDDYDTDSCSGRCEDMDHRNGTKRVDECDECLDDQSCTGAVFTCSDECIGIVP